MLIPLELADNSVVEFEVPLLDGDRGGVLDGGRLAESLDQIGKAASEIVAGLRSSLSPDQLEVEFGIALGGKVHAWFFCSSEAQATVKVTVKWNAAAPPTT